MQIQIDTREKARAITKILAEFERQGVRHYSSKLYVGDYMSLDNPRLIIDRKQNLQELCGNVCQQHKRFTDELKRAQEANIKLMVLCEHGGNIKTLSDVNKWYNPRLKVSPMAMNGPRLFKVLYSISKKYEVDFEFCTKAQTGKRIIELLGGDADGKPTEGARLHSDSE